MPSSVASAAPKPSLAPSSSSPPPPVPARGRTEVREPHDRIAIALLRLAPAIAAQDLIAPPLSTTAAPPSIELRCKVAPMAKTNARFDGRSPDALRPVEITLGF